MRFHARRASATAISLLAAACAGRAARPASAPAATARAAAPLAASDVAALLGALAADSMEGRATATPGAARAARFIAAQLAAAGARPAGDSGFFQRVPLAVSASGRGLRLVPSLAALDSVPAERRRTGANVVAVIPGSDPALRDSAVVVSAHYDHLGMGAPSAAGDSIYNGADDDASGVVAVLGVARALGAGPPPRRTVVFLLATGEELGLLGTRWYVAHPVVPIARTVANVNVEMIARPDSLAGGAGRAWLTGFERSTLGAALRTAGIALVPDPRPAENFFLRSDNVAFAVLGVPAHTISTYNGHADYHTPADEASRADAAHMATVIDAVIRAVRLVADGPAPQWNPGGRPDMPRVSPERR